MKIIQNILFFCLLITSFTTFAQSKFPVPQNLGSKSTQLHVPGLLITDTGFVLKSYIDTTAANVAQITFNGSLIKIDSSLFLYHINKWVKIITKPLDTLPLSIRINNNTTNINLKVNISDTFNMLTPYRVGINNNTIAITTKQSTLISGTNIKTINGGSLLGSGDFVIKPSLQAVTDIDSTSSHQIIAKTFNATSPPTFATNADAIAGNLRNGDFYKIPYNNGNYLLGIVVSGTNPITPPPVPNNSMLTENGTPLLNENGTVITTQ